MLLIAAVKLIKIHVHIYIPLTHT